MKLNDLDHYNDTISNNLLQLCINASFCVPPTHYSMPQTYYAKNDDVITSWSCAVNKKIEGTQEIQTPTGIIKMYIHA